METREQIIEIIYTLANSESYIYMLCMMIVNDMYCDLYSFSEQNPYKKLLSNEFSQLLSYVLEKPIDLSYPNDFVVFMNYKKETYDLFEQLHETYIEASMPYNSGTVCKPEEFNFHLSLEAMQYAGEGAYEFQYKDFLERKYINDKEYLWEKCGFDIPQIKQNHDILRKIQLNKIKGVRTIDYEKLNQYIETEMKDNSDEEKEAFKFCQYLGQFYDIIPDSGDNEILKTDFCRGILDLLSITVEDIMENPELEGFLEKFTYCKETNDISGIDLSSRLLIFKEKPIIKLETGSYFIPLLNELYKSVYESPFYWMQRDKGYCNIAAKNRGTFGEEIVQEFIENVFGIQNVYRSVTLKDGRNDLTEIDVLCTLEEYAIIIQVKSKKLTYLARQGSYDDFKRDIRLAFQEAYEQGVKCRNALLSSNIKLYDEKNIEIKLPQKIKEAYILCVTTENLASISAITSSNIEKKGDDPYPVFVSIFELELLVHYLNRSELFMYFMRQRTELGKRISSLNEISVLAWFLKRNLVVSKEFSFIDIGQDCALDIDQDYILFRTDKANYKNNNNICTWMQDIRFVKICNDVMKLEVPEKIDVVFALYWISLENKKTLTDCIYNFHGKAIKDKQYHNMTLKFDYSENNGVGFTYVVSSRTISEFTIYELKRLSSLRKYATKCNLWIGLGGFIENDEIISFVYIDPSPWKYDENMERKVKEHETRNKLKNKKKIGRNEKCPCGSGKKYKKCCGRYQNEIYE